MREPTAWRRRWRRRGVAPGDRVAVYLANRLEFIDLFLASVRLGAIFTPINVLYRDREIAHIVADAAPRLVVAEAPDPDAWPSARRSWHSTIFWPRPAGSPAVRVRHAVDGDDPAAIIYTSGTTGRSKGAVLSHNNLLANTANILAAWRITNADRYLAVLPLFHVHGLANGVCAWLASGCRMRLVERFEREGAAALFDVVSADDVLRRAHHLRAAPRAGPGHHASARRRRAPVRQRICARCLHPSSRLSATGSGTRSSSATA